MFDLLISVGEADGPFSAVLLFLVLAGAGIWLVMRNGVVILILGSIGGLVAFHFGRGLVDRVKWMRWRR